MDGTFYKECHLHTCDIVYIENFDFLECKCREATRWFARLEFVAFLRERTGGWWQWR